MDVSFICLIKSTCDGIKIIFVVTQFSCSGLDRLHPLPDPNENGSKSNAVGSFIEAEQLLEVSSQTTISVGHNHMDGISDYDNKTDISTISG